MISKKKYLRTFDNYSNVKFIPDPNFDDNNITKKSIDIKTKKTFIILENVLSNQECDNLIAQSDPFYEKLDDEYKIDERDSYRTLAEDDIFAKILYDRIKPYLNDPSLNGIMPCGFGVDGLWHPEKINSCFRYCKYVQNSRGFAPHRDATYIQNENLRSICTILVYLNDNFEGGETSFYKTLQKRKIYQTVADEMKEGFIKRYQYKPIKGSVLIFNHNMIHAGEPLISDSKSKYIIRSDVVFNCERFDDYNRDWMKDKYFLETVELYREAFNQELDGNLESSSYLYQKAIALRQYHK